MQSGHGSIPEDHCQRLGRQGVLMMGPVPTECQVLGTTPSLPFYETRPGDSLYFKLYHLRKFLREKQNENFHELLLITTYTSKR